MQTHHVNPVRRSATSPAQNHPLLLRPSEVALFLDISPQTVNNWHRSGTIPTRISEGRIARIALPDLVAELMNSDPKGLNKIDRNILNPQFRNQDLQLSKNTAPHFEVFRLRNGAVQMAPLVSPSRVAFITQTTPQTVNSWYRRKVIPGIRVDGVVRFDLEEVLGVLAKRAVAKRCEILAQSAL